MDGYHPSAGYPPPPALNGDGFTSAGNSCYLASVVAAMYAGWDAFDGLMQPPPPPSPPRPPRSVSSSVHGDLHPPGMAQALAVADSHTRMKAHAVAAAAAAAAAANDAAAAATAAAATDGGSLFPSLPPAPPLPLPPLPHYAAVDHPATAAAGSAGGDTSARAPAARDPASPAASRLRASLRDVVHALRSGSAVSAATINALRDAVLDAGFGRPSRDGGSAPRSAQEDPTEFFLALIDALGAPFLPLDERLAITNSRHALAPCSTDERVVTERMFFLPVPDDTDVPQEGVGLGDLLGRAFGGADVDGVRRVCARSGREVLVGGKLLTTLLPFYTPHEGGGDRMVDADVGNFAKVALPLVLSRGRVGGVDKCRTRVAIPRLLPAGGLVAGGGGGHTLALRSVVVHLGSAIEEENPGHYVAYVMWGDGWWRFNDIAPRGRRVVALPSGSAAEAAAVEEMERDGYLLFYELQSGDSSATAATAGASHAEAVRPAPPGASSSLPSRNRSSLMASVLSPFRRPAASPSSRASSPIPASACTVDVPPAAAVAGSGQQVPVRRHHHHHHNGRGRQRTPSPPLAGEQVHPVEAAEAAEWGRAFDAADMADSHAALVVAAAADAAEAAALATDAARREEADAEMARQLQAVTWGEGSMAASMGSGVDAGLG
ncbi:hypothetical protein I4F81_010259 [Pyropia yezoensis]|uniref:Uncharacterized protein n=1 Tax=Pyropia yezoensis TaxID=2788 RepID=A0ACC3CCF3_PYRYE|nr:hypothetical protein I4F81_010259 [Neopyropia yezoensis]